MSSTERRAAHKLAYSGFVYPRSVKPPVEIAVVARSLGIETYDALPLGERWSIAATIAKKFYPDVAAEFAAELLMPEIMVDVWILNGARKIDQLARLFDVPESVVQVRLASFLGHPVTWNLDSTSSAGSDAFTAAGRPAVRPA